MFMKVDDLFTGSVGVKEKNGVNLTIDCQFPPLRHKGDLHFLVTEAGTESNFLNSVIDEQVKSGVTVRTRAREARPPDRIVLPAELLDLHYSPGGGSLSARENQGKDNRRDSECRSNDVVSEDVCRHDWPISIRGRNSYTFYNR